VTGYRQTPSGRYRTTARRDATIVRRSASVHVFQAHPGSAMMRAGAILAAGGNRELGSAIANGTLYAADIDTVRSFDLKTGAPKAAVTIPEANVLNGIAAAADAAVYVSNTRDPQRIYKVTPDGKSSIFVNGAPLSQPNGVALDPAGNIVVINIGDNTVLTFDKSAKLIKTEHSNQSGNDGLVVLSDGTKYVTSVRFGSVSRIRPGKDAEIIASGIPSPASSVTTRSRTSS